MTAQVIEVFPIGEQADETVRATIKALMRAAVRAASPPVSVVA